jgi:hypothetical protein
VVKQGTGERHVVSATVVTQVNRGPIGLAPSQGAQSLETSAGADEDRGGADMAQHDLQRRIVAAGQSEHSVRLKQAGCCNRSVGGNPGPASISQHDHSAVGQISRSAADGG